jgi:hypothetical protein
VPAALLGFTLRSFLLPRGSRYVSVRQHPPTVSPAVATAAKQRAGPAGRGFWALTLARVPGRWRGFRTPTTGCSLGFSPFQGLRRPSCTSLRPHSSHALCHPARGPGSRRPRVSIDVRLTAPTPRQAAAPDPVTLVGFLHLCDPAIRTASRLSPSHVAFALASVGGQATVTDRLVYCSFNLVGWVFASCFAKYLFHLWPNLRLPPDAGGNLHYSAGLSPGYFLSVSLIRLLISNACR